MAGIITVDGKVYDVRVREGDLAREASILDGDNAGRLTGGIMKLDTIGTYYNYRITFVRAGDNVADYDALYEVLTDPVVRVHTITVPYGQGTLRYEAYIADVKDVLKKMRNGANYWGGMEVIFVAMKPQRRA